MADLTQSPAPMRDLWGRLDKVLLTCAAIALALLLFDRPAFVPSVQDTIGSLIRTAPYILFAILAIAYMRASGSERLLDGAFHGAETRMIIFAALGGGLSPFCSCQVIPFVAALLAAGAPISAVMAFWLSSPLMDPSMFAITAGELGWNFAIAKTAAAVGMGLFGGFTLMAMKSSRFLEDPLKARTPAGCGSCCGAPKLTVNWRFWQDANRRTIFGQAAWENLFFLGKWMMLAYLLETLLIRYVPASWIATALGGEGVWSVILGAILGAPAYLNGYAAVPLIGGLIEQGMTQGAAMAFVIAGGVSCIPAAVAVWALVKPRIFALYLGFAVVGAIFAGLAWGLIA